MYTKILGAKKEGKKPLRVKWLRGKCNTWEYGAYLYAGLWCQTMYLCVEGNLSLAFVQGKCIFVSAELLSRSGKRLCLLQFLSKFQISLSLLFACRKVCLGYVFYNLSCHVIIFGCNYWRSPYWQLHFLDHCGLHNRLQNIQFARNLTQF